MKEKNGTNGTVPPVEPAEPVEQKVDTIESSFFGFAKRSKKGGLSMEQDAIRRFGMAQQAPDFTNEDMKLPPWTDISRKLYRVCTSYYNLILIYDETISTYYLIDFYNVSSSMLVYMKSCNINSFITGKENIA